MSAERSSREEKTPEGKLPRTDPGSLFTVGVARGLARGPRTRCGGNTRARACFPFPPLPGRTGASGRPCPSAADDSIRQDPREWMCTDPPRPPSTPAHLRPRSPPAGSSQPVSPRRSPANSHYGFPRGRRAVPVGHGALSSPSPALLTPPPRRTPSPSRPNMRPRASCSFTRSARSAARPLARLDRPPSTSAPSKFSCRAARFHKRVLQRAKGGLPPHAGRLRNA